MGHRGLARTGFEVGRRIRPASSRRTAGPLARRIDGVELDVDFGPLDTDGNGAFRERYWSRFGERAPVLNALGQSTYEGVAFLRGLLDHRQRDNGSVAFESVRATRWRSNADKAMPIYLAQADGMRFRVIQTLEGSG